MNRILLRLRRVSSFNPIMSRLSWPTLNGTVTCLLYHRVAEHGSQDYLERGGVPVTPPVKLARHLDEILSRGGQFFTFDEILSGRMPEPSKPGFVITFDDGYRDNFTTGREILNQFGIRGVFFVATDMVDRKTLLWEHLLYYLGAHEISRRRLRDVASERLSRTIADSELFWMLRSIATVAECDDILGEASSLAPLTSPADVNTLYPRWQDVRATASEGHQIGSHTVRHRMRHLLTRTEFAFELVRSKCLLEEQLQQEVSAFSYPFNNYLFSDEELCREAGYRLVATVDRGRFTARTSHWWIPRLTLHGMHDNMSAFRQAILSEAA